MRFIVLLLLLTVEAQAAGQPQFSDVFVAGRNSFLSVRIPSVIVTKRGTVLALAEGRAQPADQAENKIILRRSLDGGNTWFAQQVIADDGHNSLNNPCAVVDDNTGRIIVMFQCYPAGHTERDGTIIPGLAGPAVLRNYVITSDDDGLTWSKIHDVTRSTKHAKYATIAASGPGIGIQLHRGAHKNRIIIPFNEGPFGQWNVLAIFSDDNGNHWRIGHPAPGCCVTNSNGSITCLVNEVQMVELSNGSVMLNSRSWGGSEFRKTAISHDGGLTWSKIMEEPALPAYNCMASIFRYSFPGKGTKNCILYSGPTSDQRRNGTIRASYDDGKTWPVSRTLFPGSFAYSVLTKLPDGTVGCLFETDDMTRIVFARFPLTWLENTKKSSAK